MSSPQSKNEIRLTTFDVATMSGNVPFVNGESEKSPQETPSCRDSYEETTVSSPMDAYLIEPETPFKNRWTLRLLYCSVSSIIGSTFMFGYNGLVINEPELLFKQFLNQSYFQQFQYYPESYFIDNLWSWTVSLFLIGGMIGGLVGGAEANHLGSKRALLVNCIVGVVSGVLMFMAPFVNVFELLMIGRFIAGIQCGAVSAIVPAYLTEIAPLSLRGAAGTMNQLSIVTGGLFSAILGLPIALGRDDPTVWPFLLFPCVALPALQMVLMLFCVENPLWLMMVKSDENETFAVLSKLRESDLSREAIQTEVDYLRSEREAKDAMPKLTLFQTFTGSLGWPLVICVMMQLAQQLSGINAIMYYGVVIFGEIAEEPIPEYVSFGVVGTIFVMTVVSIFIIERMGRRPLMIIGIFGMWVLWILLTIFLSLSHPGSAFNYLAVASVFLFVMFFAIGPGSIPWFIAPELSLPQYRPMVIAICTFVNWSGNLANGLGYPVVNEHLATYSFVPYIVVLTICLVFSVLFLPETKGLPPETSIERLSFRKIQLNCGPCNRSETAS